MTTGMHADWVYRLGPHPVILDSSGRASDPATKPTVGLGGLQPPYRCWSSGIFSALLLILDTNL